MVLAHKKYHYIIHRFLELGLGRVRVGRRKCGKYEARLTLVQILHGHSPRAYWPSGIPPGCRTRQATLHYTDEPARSIAVGRNR